MALGERGLANEQFADLTCGAENLSPYSSPTAYADTPSYYQTDFEWQQHQQQHQQQLQQHHQQQIMETDRHFYGTFPESGDVIGHGFQDFPHQTVTHGEFYPQQHVLWQAGTSPDSLAVAQLTQHHRLFSGIDLSQQASIQPSSTGSSPTGKPKRKRVQTHSQRKAANVRERKRMFHLNEAFDELRKRLPAFNYEKRLSRIETLRLAMTYISFMKEVSVGRDPKCVKLKPHGPDLSPFPLDGDSSLMHASYSGSDNNDNNNCKVMDDSDCSNDELSNHSGGN